MGEPAASPTEVFAERAKQARVSKGWSQEALARYCTDDLGHPLNRTVIGQIEDAPHVRSQRVTLADVLTICLALNISPTDAITPSEQSVEVKLTPGFRCRSWEVRQWVKGDLPLGATDHADIDRYLGHAPRTSATTPFAHLRNMINDLDREYPTLPTNEAQDGVIPEIRAALDVISYEVESVRSKLKLAEARAVREGRLPKLADAAQPNTRPLEPDDPIAQGVKARRTDK